MIALERDDGSTMALSKAEARRAYDAYMRALLTESLRTPVVVGRCSRECVACEGEGWRGRRAGR